MPKKMPKPTSKTSSATNADELESNWVAAPMQSAAVDAPESADPKSSGKKRKRSKEALSQVDETDPVVAPKKKKRRKKNAGRRDAEAMPVATLGAAELCEWSASRLAAAWVAEAKAAKLAPLEAKELRPATAWFAACPPTAHLTRVPWQFGVDGGDASSQQLLCAVRDDSSPPTPPSGDVFVAVLCISAERAFAALEEISESWKVRPAVLASHGGGRKNDQIARQAQAIASGSAVAIGTPSRFLRLIDEGHLNLSSLETLIIDLARDRKRYDVLSLIDLRRDVFSLIRRHFLPSIQSGRCRIIFCSGDVEVSAGSVAGKTSSVAAPSEDVKKKSRREKAQGKRQAVSKQKGSKRRGKLEKQGK